MMRLAFGVVILFCFCEFSAACPGLFGMGGCGGGCGGGGGCGRRKRSIDGVAEEFFGISSNQKDMLCNSPEMRRIMEKGMRKSAVDSSKAIQTMFESHDLFRYVVICSESPFVYTVRIETAYCSSRNENHFCQAFAI